MVREVRNGQSSEQRSLGVSVESWSEEEENGSWPRHDKEDLEGEQAWRRRGRRGGELERGASLFGGNGRG